MGKIVELSFEIYKDNKDSRLDDSVYVIKELHEHQIIISGNYSWGIGGVEVACERAGKVETKQILVREGNEDIELTFEEYVDRVQKISDRTTGKLEDFKKKYRIYADVLLDNSNKNDDNYYYKSFNNEHFEELPYHEEGSTKLVAYDLPLEIFSKLPFINRDGFTTSFQFIER